jgi:hypothetical protein
MALAALMASAPAFAFQVKSVPDNSSAAAKFTDPDDLTDRMASDLSGGRGTTLHFGSTSVTAGGGGTSTGLSPALQERLMLGPDGSRMGAGLH